MNYPEGTHYKDYRAWEERVGDGYDYEREGLNKRILSNVIVSSKNPVLQIMLGIYEYSIIWWSKYIDILKNFKNIHWKNR